MPHLETAYQASIAPGTTVTHGVAETPGLGADSDDLLDVLYDWDRVPVPRSLREFTARRANISSPLDVSGVWRFREMLRLLTT
ncbi:MAG: hypothetical protein WD176_01250, partial [Pirellulales bacterium]